MAASDSPDAGLGDAPAAFGDEWKAEVQDRIDDFIDSLRLGGLEREAALEELIATRLYDQEINSRSLQVRLAERCANFHSDKLIYVLR